MKKYLSMLLSLALATCTGPAFADAVIFSGNDVKALKSNLDLNGQAKVLSGTVDPTASATSAPIGSIYLNTSNGNTYRKLDSGSSTNWSIVGSAGSSGINYVTNSGIESTITGISAYADAAATSPVDGTGGSPTTTIVRTTTGGEVLRGTASAKWAKSAANRQGEGFSTDIAVDPADYTGVGKAIIVKFDYLITGTYVDDDMKMFVYDKDGAVVQSLYANNNFDNGLKGSNCTVSICTFTGTFYTTTSNNDYRIIWHTATTSASAYTVYVDNIRAGPEQTVPGAIMADLGTEAWTVVNATATSSVRLNRIGNRIIADGTLSFTGSASGTIGLTIPAGYAPSTNDYSQLGTSNFIVGWAKLVDTGTGTFDGTVQLSSTSNLSFVAENASGTYITGSNTSNTIPHTWANTDKATFHAEWIVSGWAASATVTANDTVVSTCKARYTKAAAQTISSGVDTILDASTKDYDSCNAVTTGASWKFTAPKSAWYHIDANLQWVTRTYADGNFALLKIFKNGSNYAQYDLWESSGTPAVIVTNQVHDDIYLLKGEYIDVRARNDGSTSTNTDGMIIAVDEKPDYTVFATMNDRLSNVVSKSANYTALGSDSTIIFTADATLSLPAAADYRGKEYDVYSSGTGTDVTIDPNASETVCGATTVTVNGSQDGLRIKSDGTNWIGLGGQCRRHWTVSGNSGSTSITGQIGNCITSITNPGAGRSAVNFGNCSIVAPVTCTIGGSESGGSNTVWAFAAVPTTSAVEIRSRIGGTLTSADWNMECSSFR